MISKADDILDICNGDDNGVGNDGNGTRNNTATTMMMKIFNN